MRPEPTAIHLSAVAVSEPFRIRPLALKWFLEQDDDLEADFEKQTDVAR